jgi:hypothetical protein
LLRIAYFTPGTIAMIALQEANADARVRKKELKYFFKTPSTLRPLRARAVGVDVLGYVNDPGFKD